VFGPGNPLQHDDDDDDDVDDDGFDDPDPILGFWFPISVVYQKSCHNRKKHIMGGTASTLPGTNDVDRYSTRDMTKGEQIVAAVAAPFMTTAVKGAVTIGTGNPVAGEVAGTVTGAVVGLAGHDCVDHMSGARQYEQAFNSYRDMGASPREASLFANKETDRGW
jgi:hypothetical protein